MYPNNDEKLEQPSTNPSEATAQSQQPPPQQHELQSPEHPSASEIGQHEQQGAAWSMYSPSICVNQPPPKTPADEISVASRQEGAFSFGSFMRAVALVLVCTLFSAAATYFVIDYRLDRGDFAPTVKQVVLGGDRLDPPPQSPQVVFTDPLVGLPEAEMTAQDIYDLALTQVVGISVTLTDDSRYFRNTQGQMPSVTGSGFVVSSDGYILTNYHVIEMAISFDVSVDVVLHDGETYEAEIVGYEEDSDVAVLKIDALGLNPAVFSDSDNLRVGQTVYAVGNPFGDLVYTMTDGIVSALDRVVTVEGKTISTFQFSAAVNSGNSGGPIYNTNGEVIGIVTAKVIRGNVEGIGFAIPINDAIKITSELIENGYISGRPLLGITISQAQADYYDWVVGVYVKAILPDSAAEKAGLHVGDIITAIEDDEVDSLETMKYVLRQWNAGDTATITVWRDGETLDLSITFDEDLAAGKPKTTNPPSD